MSLELPFDPADEQDREHLAAASYYRERAEEAAADREHNLEPCEYVCLEWGSLSSFSQRPYRVAVATVCDALVAAARAA